MLRINTPQQYSEAQKRASENPIKYWESIAEHFSWHKRWDKVQSGQIHDLSIKWFEGAKLNITENCLDRHLEDRADQTAIIWQPNDPNRKAEHITYASLYQRVCKCANALREMGVGKGDRICIYMPMVAEIIIAALACARIGAVHSVVFAGFSAKALADRIEDVGAKLVITADGNYRGSKTIAVKKVVDDALALGCSTIENVLVFKNTAQQVNWNEEKDVWWHDIVDKQSSQCEAEVMDAEDMLFVLYTSGSTGSPKGVVHTCAGYMVYAAYSFLNAFQYRESDIFWCTADVGWITGHTYMTYGPLLAGATQVIFEGVPTYPDAGRFWQICEQHSVTHFYTAPTAIRALMAKGDSHVEKADLSSLKVLGSVGEPINEEAWHWYYDKVGNGNCALTDTWWQTETGGIMIASLAGISVEKPGFATLPLPGIQACLVDKDGNTITENGIEGLLCIEQPWPSMIRNTYGNKERCLNTYFSPFPGKYFTGDSARRDENGLYRIIGRVDDVINVSGHRLGTAEIENAINEHNLVIESAVVGYPHPIKGQGIYAFIIGGAEGDEAFFKEIRQVVTKHIGPIAKPDKVIVVSDLPKTRSGKIMRRILRKAASGDNRKSIGDTSTLLNPSVVDEIFNKVEK